MAFGLVVKNTSGAVQFNAEDIVMTTYSTGSIYTQPLSGSGNSYATISIPSADAIVAVRCSNFVGVWYMNSSQLTFLTIVNSTVYYKILVPSNSVSPVGNHGLVTYDASGKKVFDTRLPPALIKYRGLISRANQSITLGSSDGYVVVAPFHASRTEILGYFGQYEEILYYAVYGWMVRTESNTIVVEEVIQTITEELPLALPFDPITLPIPILVF